MLQSISVTSKYEIDNYSLEHLGEIQLEASDTSPKMLSAVQLQRNWTIS